MVDHHIDREAVAIGGNDARDHKQQGPKEDEDDLEDDQEKDPREHAEAVQEIADGRLAAAHRVHDEKGEADPDDRHRQAEQRVNQAGAGTGCCFGHHLHNGLGIAFRSEPEHLVHRVRVHARQAEGEPADERRQQRIKERRRQHAGLRLADQLFGLQLGRRSVYDHENHLCLS